MQDVIRRDNIRRDNIRRGNIQQGNGTPGQEQDSNLTDRRAEKLARGPEPGQETDVTDIGRQLLLAERALRQTPENTKLVAQSKLIRALFDDLPDAVIVVSLQREFLLVNPASEALLDYRADEMIGRSAKMIYLREDDFKRFGRHRFSLSASGSTLPLVAEFRRADGSTFIGETIGSLIQDEAGAPLGFLAITRNVSEKRKAEAVLSELFEVYSSQTLTSEERIQEILGVGCRYFDLPIGIVSCITDSDYRVEFLVAPNQEMETGQVYPLNQTICEITVGAGEPLAFHSILDTEYKDHPCYEKFQVQAYMGAPLEVNGEAYGTVSFCGSSPREQRFQPFDYEIQRHFAVWIGSELARLQSLFRLLSTRREAIEQRMLAEKANAAKSEFLAIMSHELRTPMTGLLGNLDLLESEGLNAEQQGFCELVRESAQGLMSILNDILDLSKIEAGQLDLEETPVRLRGLLADVMQLFRPLAEEKGLNFELFVAPEVPDRVMGDSVRLKQLLSNLLSNAVKFTEVGGIRLTLSVAAATSPPRAAKFALAGSLPGEDDRLTLVFEVQDTGPGIALEKIQHIFDSFTQADISTTRRFGGTGLGLTICRQLVEVMNGQIDVESAPDRGAVFRVTLAGVRPVSLDTPCLPLSPVSSLTTRKAAHLLPPGDRAASRQKVRILLAEDNDVNARLIETMMTRMGFEVTAVPTGAEALEELAQRSYDIILMDMHMPKMDGVEATQKIRALPGKQARIPIVALTADAITANRESYENIGLTAFLTKPIDWSLLEETLHAVARQASGQQVDRGSDQGLDPAATPGGPPADGKKPAGLPLVDETYLLDMIEVLGRENLDELLTNAQRSLEEALAACEAAVLAADLTAQREVLHRIKGLSGTLGGRRLSGLAGQGEEALRQAQALPFPAASVRLLVRATNARLAQFQKKYFRAPQADPLSERPPAQ